MTVSEQRQEYSTVYSFIASSELGITINVPPFDALIVILSDP